MISILHVPQLKWCWEYCPLLTFPDSPFLTHFPQLFQHTLCLLPAPYASTTSSNLHICSCGSFCLEVPPYCFDNVCIVYKFFKRITHKLPLSWRIPCVHCPLNCNSILSFLWHMPSITSLVVKGPSAGLAHRRAQPLCLPCSFCRLLGKLVKWVVLKHGCTLWLSEKFFCFALFVLFNILMPSPYPQSVKPESREWDPASTLPR